MARLVLGTLMVGAGASHLTVSREDFRAQMPSWFPFDEDLTVLGPGVAEIGLGAAFLALPPVRAALMRSSLGPYGGAVTAPPQPDRLRLSRKLAVLMDDLVRIPGTRRGVGLDALIGLVPGIGDLVGSGLSAAIMLEAVRNRVPIPVLARMAWNLLLDAALGLVPFVGDLADVAHRANRRNYRLLERAVLANPDPQPPSVGYLLAALALTVLPLLISVALGVLVLVVLVRWLV